MTTIEGIITIIIVIIIIVLLYRYSNKELKNEKLMELKEFRVRSIMYRLILKDNQYAELFDGLVLINEKQPIQIKAIYNNQTVLLVNRLDPNKQIKIKLNKLSLENLDNTRNWVLNNLYLIKTI